MNLRELPPEEWHKLIGTELGKVINLLPDTTKIAVVEESGIIIGCWSITPIWHAEGIWIHPSHRASIGVGKRLLNWLYNTANENNINSILTGSLSPTIDSYCKRLGGKLSPGNTYILPIKKG